MRYSSLSSNEIEFNILRARAAILSDGWHLRNSKSVFSRLYFVEEGGGSLSTKDTSLILEPNHVYLIPPECAITADSDYLKKIFFHITLPTPDGYDLLQDVGAVFVLPCSDELLLELRQCALSDNYFDMLRLNALVLSTLVDFQKTFAFPLKENVHYSDLVYNILKYIRQNTRISLTVSDIAKAFFRSESSIRKAFMQEVNIPLGKYIDDMVFIKANYLLSETSIPISQISSELGFCDQFYFSRRFKELFSQTPSQYRNGFHAK